MSAREGEREARANAPTPDVDVSRLVLVTADTLALAFSVLYTLLRPLPTS
jgi:hypothetical protein